MRKSEKNAIYCYAASLSDDELLNKYYDSVDDCLGSVAELMIELDYDICDVKDRLNYEKYLSELSDILEELCLKRGLKLWEK